MGRKLPLRVQCGHSGCSEIAFYEADTRADHARLQDRYGNGRYRCSRHQNPEEVLSEDRRRVTYEIVSQESKSGKFWGNWGFLYGPGFKAFASDFPAGTILRVIAEIVLPSPQPDAVQADDVIDAAAIALCDEDFGPEKWNSIDGRRSEFRNTYRKQARIVLAAANLLRQSAPADAAAMREATRLLEKVAAQKFSNEIENPDDADFEGAYDQIIRDTSRAFNIIRALPLAQPDTRDATIKALVKALKESSAALLAMLDAVRKEPEMQKRKYVDLGIQCMNAAKKTAAVLTTASGRVKP